MVAISANIDIGSTFSNINFSYPEVDIDGNTKNGYLDLFGNSTYLHFNYDSIKIDETNKQLCVIHKSPDDTKIAYIVFNYVKGTNYDKLYNKPYIHLNHHIANEIVEGSTLRYDSDGFHILGDSSTPSKILIYFKNTMLKLNTDNIPNTIKGTITMPTISTTPATKTFKRGMFINDEVDCGESTIGSAESSVTGSAESSVTGTGQIKPLSNSQAKYTYYGVALIMGGLLLQYAILILLEKWPITYPANTKLLTFFPPGYNYKFVFYLGFTVIAFIASIAFFLLYGIFGPSTKNPSSSYWYYLALAIFYLLAFISYLWWKVTYLTPA